MITLMHLPIRHGNAPLRIAHGHFATNHSHINYYVDITYQKPGSVRPKTAPSSWLQTLSTTPRWTPFCAWTAPACWAPVLPRS